MIKINEIAIVSCYVDAASLLIMIELLFLSARLRWQKSAAMKLFSLIGLFVAINCGLCFITNAMYLLTSSWSHTTVVIARLLRELDVLAVNVLWILYVYHRVYGGDIRHSVGLYLAFLPLAALLVLNIVNLFTGVLYTYSSDNRFRPTSWLYYSYALEFIYFCSSVFIVRYYDKKEKKIRFFHITPMILPVFLMVSVQLFTPYDIGILGYAIGATMMHFSLIGENRFIDAESGLYNNGYLSYLFDMALLGKSDTYSALILEADGNLPVCFKILRDTLHKDGDVIRVDTSKFMMFSKEKSRSTIQYQASVLDETVEKHNSEHPEEKVHIAARCRMRTDQEDAFTFLRGAMDDRESGNEMRGIVSMISELDRLDNELKLAADIQIHMLPMTFPPFPERKEFALYASMHPAKEVGGDFYDFFLVDSDHLALVIADVSGKGIPAALFMMVSKTLIKNQLMLGVTPAQALSSVNAQLCERNAEQMFVTVWAAVIEISTGRGMACNAGHENPGLMRAGGAYELIRYKHNMFLGVNKKVKYEDRPFELNPGDSLFVYTDGVPEANNAESEMFGNERLKAALNADPDADPEKLLGNVKKAVDEFVNDAPQFDDLTMLAFQYYGSQAVSD